MCSARLIAEEDAMVYTDERLKRALDVFRDSDPYRRRRGLPGSNLERFLESRSKQYETRSGQSSLAVRTTCTGVWNDKDDGDDYRPRNKRGVVRPPKPGQNSSKRKLSDEKECNRDRAPKRIKASYTTGRQKGLILEARFKFNSDAAKAKLAELFPAAVPHPQLSMNGHHKGGSDTKDCRSEDAPNLLDPNDISLFPPSPATSFQSHMRPSEFLLDNGTEAQIIDLTTTTLNDEPAHHRFPTACESDPIIIDDSDDSRSDYGELPDDPELCELVYQTKIIKTNWAHPVDYRCKPEACNFCQDFRYPLFGCGLVRIEVIQIEPGIYEEMGGGHREKGMVPTKICLNCSLERIAVAKCPGHDVLLIDGCLEEEFDHQSFLNHIASSDYLVHPSCSICIKPAFYACSTKQKEDPCGLPITGEEVDGCGLLLCSDCAGIVASHGLDMGRLEGSAEGSKILRADRDFLLPGSDLWQAWKK